MAYLNVQECLNGLRVVSPAYSVYVHIFVYTCMYTYKYMSCDIHYMYYNAIVAMTMSFGLL